MGRRAGGWVSLHRYSFAPVRIAGGHNRNLFFWVTSGGLLPDDAPQIFAYRGGSIRKRLMLKSKPQA